MAGAGGLLIAAIAIVALAKGMAGPNPQAQASLGPTFTPIPPQAVTDVCVKEVSPLVSSLESLNAAVTPSIAFAQYSAMFTASQAARDQVDIAKLDPPCAGVFARAQAVLGEQGEAFNMWNDCNGTTGCTRQSIESSLESHWANARAMLSNVKASMP